MRFLISGTAAAASGMLTVMRTSSEPARASSMHWVAVDFDVDGVGVRHRLDDDGRAAADHHLADPDPHGLVAFALFHDL